MEFGAKLKVLANKFSDDIVVVMRTYFEKPRTRLGWKGYINDPDLDGTFNMDKVSCLHADSMHSDHIQVEWEFVLASNASSRTCIAPSLFFSSLQFGYLPLRRCFRPHLHARQPVSWECEALFGGS
jgi:hypothetical protein